MLLDKYRTLFVVAALLAITLLLASAVRWYRQLAAARLAVEELAQCRQIAARIEALRASPQTASLQKHSQQQIARSIQRAAQVAEIPEKYILHVTPHPGRRLAKSQHIEQPTTVEISQLNLGQLARLLGELSVLSVGLEPTSIRLTAPRTPPGDTQTEVWGCELVLTYLVFSPE